MLAQRIFGPLPELRHRLPVRGVFAPRARGDPGWPCDVAGVRISGRCGSWFAECIIEGVFHRGSGGLPSFAPLWLPWPPRSGTAELVPLKLRGPLLLHATGGGPLHFRLAHPLSDGRRVVGIDPGAIVEELAAAVRVSPRAKEVTFFGPLAV